MFLIKQKFFLLLKWLYNCWIY